MELRKQIANEMIGAISDCVGEYVCDLSSKMYNEDYYIIGKEQAKQFIKDNIEDVLNAIEYWQDCLGEPINYITDYERVATLTAYYISESIMNEVLELSDIWNDELDDKNLQYIIEQIEYHFDL